MNPFSFPVLGGAALLSSPALWSSLNGHSGVELGLSRYLVAALVCWVGLSVVAMLVGPPPEPARLSTETELAGAAHGATSAHDAHAGA